MTALGALCAVWLAANGSIPMRNVWVDSGGVVRWEGSREEVALYGVNTMTPFAFGYRTLLAQGASIDETIRQDVRQFRRLGFQAVRVHVWDREISDAEGHLVDNDHLRLLDRLVAECAENGIYVLLTPMTFYTNGYPGPDFPTSGFSGRWSKGDMMQKPEAVAAASRYLGEFAAHVNRYRNLAYGADPAVFGFELVNEPYQPPLPILKNTIEVWAKSIRDTGSTKPLFYCASQSAYREHNDLVAASSVEGATFGWYPTGLVAGRSLTGNYLPWVADYPIMRDSAFDRKAKAVYEYDVADVDAASLHPAVARAFRRGGAQWATQFHYVSGPLARENTPYPTHNVNLSTMPARALSMMVAAEAFRTLPRGVEVPERDGRFGAFRVDSKRDLSQAATLERFVTTADTDDLPPDPAQLTLVAGCGSSPLVRYRGLGAYFLDRVSPGVWRLEVLPDPVKIEDPYGRARLDRPIVDLVSREWTMTVRLPDLGDRFRVVRQGAKPMRGQTFRIRPGLAYLVRDGVPAPEADPGEPLVAAAPNPPARIAHQPPVEAVAGRRLRLQATVSAAEDADVRVWVGDLGLPMKRVGPYRYEASLTPKPGTLSYVVALGSKPPSQTGPNRMASPAVASPGEPAGFPLRPDDGPPGDAIVVEARGTGTGTGTVALSGPKSEGASFEIAPSSEWTILRIPWDEVRPRRGWVLLKRPNPAELEQGTLTAVGGPIEVRAIRFAVGPPTHTVAVRAAGAPETLFLASRDRRKVLTAYPNRFRGTIRPETVDGRLAMVVRVNEFGWPRHASWRHMLPPDPARRGRALVVRARTTLATPVESTVTLRLEATLTVLDSDGLAWAARRTVGPAWSLETIPLDAFQPEPAYKVPTSFPQIVVERIAAGRARRLEAHAIQSIQVGLLDDASRIADPVGLAVESIRLE